MTVLRIFSSFLAILVFSSTARGVVVVSGSANTTAPSGQPYFDNIGAVGGASGIYLGDGWVLSAAHVAGSLPSNATFGGTSYATKAGTFHRLINPEDSGLSALTDIVLFRLNVDPGLPTLNIASSTPTVGMDVMMVGRGRTQEVVPTYWGVTVVVGSNNDVWTELTPPDPEIDRVGFETTGTRTVRWGENNIAATNQEISYGFGDVFTYSTVFNDGAKAQEAQAVAGDSGGASLHFNGVFWELSGMMVAVSTFDNQPSGANTAVFGNATSMVDLSYYRDEIIGIIPEPGSTAFCIVTVVGFACRRKRQAHLCHEPS